MLILFSDLHQNWSIRQISVKLCNNKFHENPFSGSHDDGLENTAKLIGAFFSIFNCELASKQSSADNSAFVERS
jgi:hypothetical protein